jgi:phospholipid N-methyltransferase
MSSRRTFLTAILKARRTVGAVAPTSRRVARRIAGMSVGDESRVVAEFGPGTGAITRELLAALPAHARLWAFEVYPPFVQHLRSTIDDPRLTVVSESAEEIAQLRENQGLPRFDAIVSALPFSLMEREQTSTILRAAAGALAPDGIFVALQYHPRYLAPLLRTEFGKVERKIHPWNIPPALLLRATQPRATA